MSLERFVKIKYQTNEEKADKLVEGLKELGIECARIIEEKVDLQFDALRHLRENLNDDETFIKLVIANSIVSYQLSGKERTGGGSSQSISPKILQRRA